jgi:hypothetical protein
LFGGVAAIHKGNVVEIGFSANDSTYSIDFTVKHIDADSDPEVRANNVADFVIEQAANYEREHLMYVRLHITSFGANVNKQVHGNWDNGYHI